MSALDWFVLCGTLLSIVAFGIWKTRKQSRDLEGFLKGGNSDRWWTVGLSVMATQASAITFLSATGQGYEDGLRFVQIYFGLPLALILICAVFIPIYYRLKVYTAYEYLEQRFDLKTRLLTASLFLISRAFAAGITIYAPSIVLSTLFGWDLQITNLVIGLLVIAYTVSGGTKAVSITQKQQMAVIFFGMFVAFYLILQGIPESVSFKDALRLANWTGRLDAVDFSFNPETRYTIWSGIFGGFFLSLSYFGTDQSQVQRYITATDTRQSRMGLLFNAVLKIPMQFFILLVGVMLFAFYQFEKPPIYFNSAQLEQIATAQPDSVAAYQAKHDSLFQLKSIAANEALAKDYPDNYQSLDKAMSQNRAAFKAYLGNALPDAESKDTDYVFLNFILSYFPPGLIGLLLAVILSAAMSSTSSELNALTSTAVVDYFKRLNWKSNKSDLQVSRLFTLFWGVLAIVFALSASLVENLIQLVNIVGSLFYGPILGVFICGFFLKKLSAKEVFPAALAAQVIVISLFSIYGNKLSFLWLNPIGSVSLIAIALLLRYFRSDEKASDSQ
ncbi:MAG: sodium:solute symporter [Bacteroidetes bacterium]|nr:MAG: sodium:solute symporter [Bacteroidota bacterium]